MSLAAQRKCFAFYTLVQNTFCSSPNILMTTFSLVVSIGCLLDSMKAAYWHTQRNAHTSTTTKEAISIYFDILPPLSFQPHKANDPTCNLWSLAKHSIPCAKK
jgi:hypothetical protein